MRSRTWRIKGGRDLPGIAVLTSSWISPHSAFLFIYLFSLAQIQNVEVYLFTKLKSLWKHTGSLSEMLSRQSGSHGTESQKWNTPLTEPLSGHHRIYLLCDWVLPNNVFHHTHTHYLFCLSVVGEKLSNVSNGEDLGRWNSKQSQLPVNYL